MYLTIPKNQKKNRKNAGEMHHTAHARISQTTYLMTVNFTVHSCCLIETLDRE